MEKMSIQKSSTFCRTFSNKEILEDSSFSYVEELIKILKTSARASAKRVNPNNEEMSIFTKPSNILAPSSPLYILFTGYSEIIRPSTNCIEVAMARPIYEKLFDNK